MGMSADQYAQQLQRLLPPGPALAAPSGGTLAALIAGLAAEFARADANGDALLAEALPPTTDAFLPDWERIAGLPSRCAPQNQTLAERRVALIEKLAANAPDTIANLLARASAYGYDLSIVERRARRYGASYGAVSGGTPWQFVYDFDAAGTPIAPRIYGNVGYGGAYSVFGDPTMECRMSQRHQSHTLPRFIYDWSPYNLFARREIGCYFNLANMNALYQDTAGTVPVTAFGQAVQYIRDLSGNGNHLTLTTGPGAIYTQDERGVACLESAGASMYSGSDANLPMGAAPSHMMMLCSLDRFAQNVAGIGYGASGVGKARQLGLDNSAPFRWGANFYGRLVSGLPPIAGDVYLVESDYRANTLALTVNGVAQDSMSVVAATASAGLTLFGAIAPAAMFAGRIYAAVICGGASWTAGRRALDWCAAHAATTFAPYDLLLRIGEQYSRSTTATWIDPDGVMRTAVANAPRMENDIATGEPRGLLVEESRTNVITHSEVLTGADWQPTNMTEHRDQVGPDGAANSASRNVTASFTGNVPHIYPLSCFLPQPPDSLPNWVSVRIWMKRGNYDNSPDWDTSGHSKCGTAPGDSATIAIKGRIVRGPGILTVNPGGNTPDYWTIKGLSPTEWTVLETTTTVPLQLFPGYILTMHNRDTDNGGVIGDYLVLAHEQYEFAPFSSSYIPTTTASATRAADDVLVDAGWINLAAGCLYGTFRVDNLPDATVGTATIAALLFTDTPAANYLQCNVTDDGNFVFSGRAANAAFNQIRYPKGTVVAGQDCNFAIAWDSGQFRVSLAGAAPVAAAQTRALPTDPRNFCIGSALEQFYLNGTIRRLAYLPTSPSDAALQSLSAGA